MQVIMACKGKAYSHEELMNHAEKMMNRLGYKDQPTLFYAHADTADNHLHIVTTQVNKKGEKIGDSVSFYNGLKKLQQPQEAARQGVTPLSLAQPQHDGTEQQPRGLKR